MLTTCLGGEACAPLADVRQTHAVLLGVSVTSGSAWALFALRGALTGAYRRRTAASARRRL
ncbi:MULTISPECIES: hypothetical protein [Streptomyces]|uniref:hypothetical protein n=1 Tax=Streptomyces TaxID=1883 RepID=UPI001409C900|nr:MULTISPECIES: hypothetical protein [Streptomyces]MDH6228238.1 hypothetical protein [Streptomyces sp. MJP52]